MAFFKVDGIGQVDTMLQMSSPTKLPTMVIQITSIWENFRDICLNDVKPIPTKSYPSWVALIGP
jgi:hypothetical protein